MREAQFESTRVFNFTDYLTQEAFFASRRDLDEKGSGAVDCAPDNGVALLLLDRDRLACDE